MEAEEKLNHTNEHIYQQKGFLPFIMGKDYKSSKYNAIMEAEAHTTVCGDNMLGEVFIQVKTW